MLIHAKCLPVPLMLGLTASVVLPPLLLGKGPQLPTGTGDPAPQLCLHALAMGLSNSNCEMGH